MESTRVENLPPPPGVINSIKAGFDAIASHATAMLLPLLLNIFLWLGPRLRMDELFNTFRDGLLNFWLSGGIPEADVQQMIGKYDTMIPQINLFWFLRTLPIGISSLLLPQGASSTPLGDPANWQVNGFSLFGWMVLLTLIGWVGGGLYFRSVAQAAVTNSNDAVRPVWAILQTVMLSIVWTILSLVIGLPVLVFVALLTQISAVVANIAVLFLSLASMWVIVPLFFWPHGVFLRRQNFLLSIVSSVQMARFTLPTSSMFVLTVFLLSVGLNYLWTIPPEDSWMTLLGIFGHSFVTTALLAGSFIYYRDMNAWLQSVIERLRTNTPRQA